MLKNDETLIAMGKRLKVLRVMTGLKRTELSDRAGVSKTSISYWENGKGSPMTTRSISKIIDALKSAGLKCNAEWLKTGNGEPPVSFNQNKDVFNKKFIHGISINDLNFSEEINLFLSREEHAVITKISNNTMWPVFEIDDIVGGIFLPSNSIDLSKEKVCIINLDNNLDVRRVKKGSKSDLFHLSYISYDSTCKFPFEIIDVSLNYIAPVLRLWR